MMCSRVQSFQPIVVIRLVTTVIIRIMSSPILVGIPDFIVYSFRRWALERQALHLSAGQAASAGMENRILMPVDSAATRLVETWKNAITHSKEDKVDDVDASLLDTELINLAAYLQRIDSSSHATSSLSDAVYFRDAWRQYQIDVAAKCKDLFDRSRSSTPGCVKQFFASVTLRNMFQLLSGSLNKNAYADIHQEGYHIFWAMRARCGIVDADDPLESKRHKRQKLFSVDQSSAIAQASVDDYAWAREYEDIANSFASFADETKKIATDTCMAKRQRDIGAHFLCTLEKIDVVNTRSMDDHDIAYDSLCSAGLIETKLLVVAAVKTTLNLILRFLDMQYTNGRAITAYIEHESHEKPSITEKYTDLTKSYAECIQKCEIGIHSAHILKYMHDSLISMTTMIGALFPVPPGLPGDFTATLNETVKLHSDMIDLDEEVEQRIANLPAPDADMTSERSRLRNKLKLHAVAIDTNSYIIGVYASMAARVEAGETVAMIRVFIVRCIESLGADYVFDAHNIIGCTKLAAVEADAIAKLELIVTSNADIVKRKRAMSAQSLAATKSWTVCVDKWTANSLVVAPPFVLNPSNKRLIKTSLLSEDVIKSIYRHLRLSKIQTYVDEFISLYASLKMSGEHADHEEFGIQAVILDETFGTKKVDGGLTLGHMMRGIEIILTTSTQMGANLAASTLIAAYAPSSGHAF